MEWGVTMVGWARWLCIWVGGPGVYLWVDGLGGCKYGWVGSVGVRIGGWARRGC